MIKFAVLLTPLLLINCFGETYPSCTVDQLHKGMTETQLVDTCGMTQRNHTGDHTQWVYAGRMYVYTDDGVVTDWQWSD